MWEITAAALLCFLAITGFVSLIKASVFKLCKPKHNNTYLLLKLNPEQKDTEYILRSLLSRYSWSEKDRPRGIIIIDSGLSREQRKICCAICRESEFIKLCTLPKLCEYFSEKA